MDEKRILAVDDEPRYLRLMRVNLEANGYRFVGASNGEAALDSLAQEPPDLVILDVRMPGMDGYEVLEEIRQFSEVPVIFVTAMGEEADKVRGLKLGADDYLVKPFGAMELLARVEAVLRRCRPAEGQAKVITGDLQIDLAQRRIFRGDQEIRLSRTEFRLLACLSRHLGKVVTQDQLLHEVWGPEYEEGFEGLRVYVYRLRHKLERDPERPEYLLTFPGVGYTLQSLTPAASTAGA